MPRCCSSAIQSDVAERRSCRAFTAPASLASAPPYSRNFSVSVVLPASGWLMMAKVRRTRASSTMSDTLVDRVDEARRARVAGDAQVHLVHDVREAQLVAVVRETDGAARAVVTEGCRRA